MPRPTAPSMKASHSGWRQSMSVTVRPRGGSVGQRGGAHGAGRAGADDDVVEAVHLPTVAPWRVPGSRLSLRHRGGTSVDADIVGEDSYDFIVTGAGSAGCAVAGR